MRSLNRLQAGVKRIIRTGFSGLVRVVILVSTGLSALVRAVVSVSVSLSFGLVGLVLGLIRVSAEGDCRVGLPVTGGVQRVIGAAGGEGQSSDCGDAEAGESSGGEDAGGLGRRHGGLLRRRVRHGGHLPELR